MVRRKCRLEMGPAGLAVEPLDLHVVKVGSIPTGPTHGGGASTAAPWGRASIHPDGPEEPQIRLESGGGR